MKTTRSRFHLAGSTHTLYSAPELSFAPGSVQYSPPDCRTRGAGLGFAASRGAGPGRSEHPVNARSSSVSRIRFIAVPSREGLLTGCTADLHAGSVNGEATSAEQPQQLALPPSPRSPDIPRSNAELPP